MANALDNPLTADNSGLGNRFAGESYQDVLDWYDETGFGDRANPDDYNTYQIEQALQGLDQDENGHYYNGDGERVYVYRDSQELGDDTNGLSGANIVMRTEQEIRDAFEAESPLNAARLVNEAH